ncbi:hypothetical protein FRC09_003248 [Ceratobasidium sp. 395]|nr:hypothetical protein FRC09_003248 [Ceratobasidium sp. 395]
MLTSFQVGPRTALGDVTNGSSQEVAIMDTETAHTNAPTPTAKPARPNAGPTKGRTTRAATAKSVTPNGSTLESTTNQTGDKGATNDQATTTEPSTSSKADKSKTVAKPKAAAKTKATTSAGAGPSKAKGKAKAKVVDVDDAEFSPNMILALNEIAKNHMNAHIQANRTAVGLQLANQKTEQERRQTLDKQLGWLNSLKEVIHEFGAEEAKTVLDGIFSKSQEQIMGIQKEMEIHKTARAEWEARARESEKAVLELKKEQLNAEKANKDNAAIRRFEEAEKRRNS